MSRMASQITSLTIFTQPFAHSQIKENIKASRHWPLWGEFTGFDDVIMDAHADDLTLKGARANSCEILEHFRCQDQDEIDAI